MVQVPSIAAEARVTMGLQQELFAAFLVEGFCAFLLMALHFVSLMSAVC